MTDIKPFASLSSGLLARKGGAKPAMRPQGFGHFGGNIEDLGWNDMGQAGGFEPQPERVPSSIAALTPAPSASDSEEHVIPEVAPEAPPVIEQQRSIEARFGGSDRPVRVKVQATAAVVPLPQVPRAAAGTKGKAAFTLRLDPDRHLKLRLACAVNHRSAQQLVTEALDAFLDAQPELDSLAGQVPVAGGKRH